MNQLRQILFVDDDVIIGLVTKRLLEQLQLAREVVVYADSLKALDYIKETFSTGHHRPDAAAPSLIFLDIEMPGYGAFELLSIIQELAAAGSLVLEHTYFVIITSHRGEQQIKKAAAFGVLDILEKPLRPQQLEHLLARIFVE